MHMYRWLVSQCMARLVATLLSLCALAIGGSFTHAADQPAGQRVFVCGHSFHIFIAGPLGQMAKAGGIEGYKDAGRQMLGGSRVQQHWDLPDDKNTLKKALRAGEVDVLTCSPHLKLPDEGIDKFTALLLEHNPNGRVYIQASWYPYDLAGKNNQNFKNDERDKADLAAIRKGYEPFYTGLCDQTQAINKQYEEKYKRPVAFLVPVGHAVYVLRDQVAAGKVPGIARQSELFTDPIGHARPALGILVTYCYYAAIYNKSPIGLPLPKELADPTDAERADKLNRVLQDIAWDAVTAEPLSGVKKP